MPMAGWPFPNRFVDLVGCRLPLQQAGMGGVTTPELAAAVASAGGLGMLAAAGLSEGDIAASLTKAATCCDGDGRFGVNFLMPFLDLRALDRAASNATVVECFWGDPDQKVVDRIHDGGALAAWQVGDVDEAVRAADAGCDIVVVQGQEAGGHVRGRAELFDLLQRTRARLADVPLVAAGGIGSGRAFAASLEAGADAVRVGTRFLAALEADVHPGYLAALVRSGATDTELTEAFSAGWPNAPHRVLRAAIAASSADPLTRSVSPPTRAFAGDVAAAALYAGTSVADVRRAQPAAAIVDDLVDEALRALGHAPASP